MKIWGQKIFASNTEEESNFVVKGTHKDLGSGTLTMHELEWHANYNAMLINSDGGKAEVFPINK